MYCYVEVRLLDCTPVEKDNIKVTLGDIKGPLSRDVHYQRVYRLRWDVTIKSHSARETARNIAYGFGLKYDAKLYISISLPAPETEEYQQEQIMELESMLQSRKCKH